MKISGWFARGRQACKKKTNVDWVVKFAQHALSEKGRLSAVPLANGRSFPIAATANDHPV
jgi:hypothetical protein